MAQFPIFPNYAGMLGENRRFRKTGFQDPAGIAEQIRSQSLIDEQVRGILQGNQPQPVSLQDLTSVYEPGIGLGGIPDIQNGAFITRFGTVSPNASGPLAQAIAGRAASGKVGVNTAGLTQGEISALKSRLGTNFVPITAEDAKYVFLGGKSGTRFGMHTGTGPLRVTEADKNKPKGSPAPKVFSTSRPNPPAQGRGVGRGIQGKDPFDALIDAITSTFTPIGTSPRGY